MKLRVLGCSGAEIPGHRPSAFLVDDSLLLDAGTAGAVLSEEEQWRIRHILVTHSHLDHICGIPLLVDNIVVQGLGHQVSVVGIRESLAAIRGHLMNGVIWPDFTAIPSPESPVMTYTEIEPGRELAIDGYRVTAYPVNHAIPAVGYRVAKNDKAILYTGDTGPTDLIWREAGEVSALIVEVSFPDAMRDIALLTGHLTPALLADELAKLARPPGHIFVTHLKPRHFASISAELGKLRIPGMRLLKDGDVHEL